MSEKVLRHLIALAGTLISGLIFVTGYTLGGLGWWWGVLGILIIYPLIVKLLSGHH